MGPLRFPIAKAGGASPNIRLSCVGADYPLGPVADGLHGNHETCGFP